MCVCERERDTGRSVFMNSSDPEEHKTHISKPLSHLMLPGNSKVCGECVCVCVCVCVRERERDTGRSVFMNSSDPEEHKTHIRKLL